MADMQSVAMQTLPICEPLQTTREADLHQLLTIVKIASASALKKLTFT
jgi:hypothetical protein